MKKSWEVRKFDKYIAMLQIKLIEFKEVLD